MRKNALGRLQSGFAYLGLGAKVLELLNLRPSHLFGRHFYNQSNSILTR